MPSIDLAEIADTVGGPVAGTAYGIMVTEDPAVGSMPQKLVEPTLDEGPHLSYAIQWYLFAAMGFGVWGYSAWMRARNDRADALDGAADDGLLSAQRAPVPSRSGGGATGCSRTRRPRTRSSTDPALRLGGPRTQARVMRSL